MSTSYVELKVHLGGYRIAKGYGRLWACHSFIGPEGKLLMDQDAIDQARRDAERYDTPMGDDYPSNVGSTGTGRICWIVSPLPDGRATLSVSVHRPGRSVGCLDGDVTVIKLIMDLTEKGTLDPDCRVTLDWCDRAEIRHWRALIDVLQFLGVGELPESCRAMQELRTVFDYGFINRNALGGPIE